MNEILNLAYTFELQGIELYKKFSNKDDVFSQILLIRKNGVELLENYAKSQNLELSTNILGVIMPQNLDDCLIKAINYELELNAFYESATDNVDDETLRDLFFRLWATSNNEYIAALKAKLYAQNLPQKTQDEPKTIKDIFDADTFNKMSATIEKFASGKATNEDLNALIKSPNFSFFGGLALGGLAAMMINKNENSN
ncbi:MAG: aminotransferase [Campylobacter sp.]